MDADTNTGNMATDDLLDIALLHVHTVKYLSK